MSDSSPSLLQSVSPAWFAAPMGLFGAGHVLARLGVIEGAPFDGAAQIVFIISGLTLLGVTLLALLRGALVKGSLARDFSDPQVMNFGSAFSIALFLAASAGPYSAASDLLLLAGVLSGLFFALLVVRQWLTLPLAPEDITPAWFLPVAGNLVAAKALFDAGYSFAGLFFGGLGFFGWLMVLPIVLNRLITAPALAPRLRPSLFILIAPPGLAASAFLSFSQSAWALTISALALGFGLFMLLVLISLVRLLEAAPFSSAWWSLTFPTAAMASAGLSLAGHWPLPGLALTAHLLAALNLALTLGVALASLNYARKRKRPLPA